MDLPSFIQELGIERASVVLREKPRTVKAWMYRERLPRPATARKIVQLSKGRLTLANIYAAALHDG